MQLWSLQEQWEHMMTEDEKKKKKGPLLLMEEVMGQERRMKDERNIHHTCTECGLVKTQVSN